MVDFKKALKNRANKPTAAEKKAAFKVQAPVTLNADDFYGETKKYQQFDGEPNWQPSDNFVGQAFYIVKVWHFHQAEFGDKIGIEFKLDPKAGDDSTVLVSFSWDQSRDALLQAFKAAKRKHKRVMIGPMTIILAEASQEGFQPYKKIVPYTEEIGEEYADYVPPKRTQKSRKAKSGATGAASGKDKQAVKRIKPVKSGVTGAASGEDKQATLAKKAVKRIKPVKSAGSSSDDVPF